MGSWCDRFVVMTNENFDAGPILQLFFNCFVCGQSTTQQKNDKKGSACKFTFNVISWKLMKNLLMIGKQCGTCN